MSQSKMGNSCREGMYCSSSSLKPGRIPLPMLHKCVDISSLFLRCEYDNCQLPILASLYMLFSVGRLLML